MLVCYDPYAGTIGRFAREEIIRMVAEAGYEGINLPIRKPFIDGTDEAQVKETQRQLAEYHLAVPSVGFGNHIVTTPSLRDEARRHFDVVIDIAKRVNAKIIGIWPNQPENIYVEDALETLVANLREMLPEASEANIALALEFEKGCPLDNYIQAMTFINETDPRLRLTCDTYHLNNYKADPYRSVIAMGEQLGDVHFSGSHRGEPGSEGDEFDFESFTKGLVEVGYNGPITMQYHLQGAESMVSACTFAKKIRETVS